MNLAHAHLTGEQQSENPQARGVCERLEQVFEGGSEMSETLKAQVREKYGQAATRAAAGQRSSCCGATSAKASCCDPITTNLYDSVESAEVPSGALQASLGCGNPTALAELRPGETV